MSFPRKPPPAKVHTALDVSVFHCSSPPIGRNSSPIHVFSADSVIVYGDVHRLSLFSRDMGRKNCPTRSWSS